jgi:ribonuclease P/MRP protein subunit RPP1
MYEAVRAHPEGESTVSRFGAAASALGYGGVVVRNARAEVVPGGFDSRDAYADAVREAYGLDTVWAVELDAERGQLRSAVRGLREEYAVVAVEGGTPERNRLAVETPEVDVLTEPMAGNGDVNHVLARAAAENGVRFEFDLGPVLASAGGERVQALRDLRKLREIVTYYDAPYVCSVRADSHLDLRAPRDLAAVGDVLGFDGERLSEGFAEWGRLVERNRERLDESFLAPGVTKGKPEDSEGCGE